MISCYRTRLWAGLLGNARSLLNAVIPGRRSGAEASPESMNTDCGVWIPGCLARSAPGMTGLHFTAAGATLA
jgi:hypothetical protein